MVTGHKIGVLTDDARGKVPMMRKLIAIALTLLLAACATTPELPPPAAGFAKIDFLSEIPTPRATRLLTWHDGRYYYASKDGAVLVVDESGKLLQTLQAKAGGDAVLKRPVAAAVGNDLVFISDSENSRVAMFSLGGKYRGSFGASGSGPGELREPQGVVFYDGVVYVADNGNDRIQLYGDNGVFIATLEIKSAKENEAAKKRDLPYQLKKPVGLDIDAEGHIHVFDGESSMIKVYNQHGGYLRHLALKGKPAGFRVAADGTYVIDLSSYTIQKFDFSGKLRYYFGSKGKGRSQFQGIAGLALHDNERIAVGDNVKGVANLFQLEAAEVAPVLQRELARTSVRLLQTNKLAVQHVAYANGAVYGVAADKKAIVRFKQGEAAETIALGKEIEPGALAIDNDASFWLIDKGSSRILHLDQNGKQLAAFGSDGSGAGQLNEPTDIAISSSGVIFVADPGNKWIQAFSREGVFLNVLRNGKSEAFSNPAAIALDAQDNLYVLDRGRTVITTFSPRGEVLGEFGRDREQPIHLDSPIGLVAGADEITVLEEDGIKCFNLKGEYLRRFGARGKGVGEVYRPAEITPVGDTAYAIADSGNQRLQVMATLRKPAAPLEVAAKGRSHGAEISWLKSTLPYISEYTIYRANAEQGPFLRVGGVTGESFIDERLTPEQRYYYRVAAQSEYGYEGAPGAVVETVAEKYAPAVMENVLVVPDVWSLKLIWAPLESAYVENYLIYEKRGDEFVKVGETKAHEFSKTGLAPEKEYTLYISTLSVDGIESEKLKVLGTTRANNRAPLVLETVDLSGIFSNSYKLYERDGLGKVRLTNNTGKPMENVKVAFTIKNYMDFPSEITVRRLEPGESQEFPLKTVFNNNILTVTEDTPVQSKMVATYFEDGKEKTIGQNQSINLYEKHRLLWSERGRFAAFVTPKDPVILNYARSIANQYPDNRDPIQWAAAIFGALGVSGVTYVQDPNNPYQITSGNTDTVDYLQYPRETMERKSGDCDDLVALYSTALESMGISTRVVEVPEHMLMMFSTGIAADSDGYTMDNMYVIQDGVLWVPVEVTLVGKSFTSAWEKGSETYYKWQEKGLSLLNVHESWNTYKPASLPQYDWKPPAVKRESIDKRFPDQNATLRRIAARTRMQPYIKAIEENPNDLNAQIQAGIIAARTGDYATAEGYFSAVLAQQPDNANVLNNRGNLRYIQDKYQEAINDYETAAAVDPNDALIHINLAKSYMALKDIKSAAAAFRKAVSIDATVKQRYRTMAIDLNDG